LFHISGINVATSPGQTCQERVNERHLDHDQHHIYYGSGRTSSSPLTITNSGAVDTASPGKIAVKRAGGGTHVFRLSGPADSARIVSRAAAPQELGWARDPRCLGVALRRISVRRGIQLRVIEADDTLLDAGFHAFEADNGFRWTNGDAVLPAGIFAGFSGPLVVELTVADTVRYLDEAARRLVA
jgi:hypothetical protein